MTEIHSAPALGARDILRNRAFLLLQTRSLTSAIGYMIYLGAILWLTYKLSGGIFLASIVIAVQTVVFTLTFLVSPLVDRLYNKRWVFVICYPLQAALAVILAVTYAVGILTVPVLIVIVVALALLWDVTTAADMTTTRLLFGKDHLFIVSGLGGALGGGVEIALYFAGGVAIALFGFTGGAYLLAALMVAGTSLAIPLSIPTPEVHQQGWWSGLLEGWQLFRGDSGRALRHLSFQQFILGFFVAAPTLLLTLIVARSFVGSQVVYAELYVAYLIGGIAAGLILGRANPRRYIGPVVIASIFTIGFLLLGAEIAVISLVASLAVWLGVGGRTPLGTTARGYTSKASSTHRSWREFR